MTLADYDTNSKLAKGSHQKLKTDGMWKKCGCGGGGGSGGGGGGGERELPAVADGRWVQENMQFFHIPSIFNF